MDKVNKYTHRLEDRTVEDLVGEILAYVDTDEHGEEIRLTTQTGKVFTIYHSQYCCEYVRIVDTEGNWRDLIGKVIEEVSVKADHGVYPEDRGVRPACATDNSWTSTDFVFRVDGATVISRWVGESNGYYSESVDIAELIPREE